MSSFSSPPHQASRRFATRASHHALIGFFLGAVAWCINCWWVLRILAHYTSPQGDLTYYISSLAFDKAFDLPFFPLSEYPDSSVWFVRLVYALCGDHLASFAFFFVLVCTVLSTLFALWLLFTRRWLALCVWWLVLPSLAAVAYRRLDFLPVACITVASIVLGPRGPVRFSRGSWASACVAAAAMLKLWPGALVAALVGLWRTAATYVRILIFCAVCVLLATPTFFSQGFDRLLSPLTYQADRGLQVEAVIATPFVLLAHIWPQPEHGWSIIYAENSKSLEVTGPGVSAALSVSSILSLVLVVCVCVGVVYRFLRSRVVTSSATRAFFLVITVGIIITAKVFSTQYVLWFVPLMIVILAYDVPTRNRRTLTLVHVNTILMLLAAALTFLVYPYAYDGVIADALPYNDPAFGQVILGVSALVVRNVVMIVIFALAVVNCLREIREESTLSPLTEPEEPLSL